MSLFATKPLEALMKDAGSESLKRTLGPNQLVAFGIGAIHRRRFILADRHCRIAKCRTGRRAEFCLSPPSAALFAGLCYSEFSTMIPIAGSAYTYAYATMGELIAWIIGWDLVLEYAVGAATVGVSWSRYVISFFHDFGITFPAQLASSPFEPITLPETGEVISGIINIPALFVVCLISTLLIIGIQESARINSIIVVIKVSVVLIFIALGWAYINPDNFTPFCLLFRENTGEFGSFGWSGVLRSVLASSFSLL